MQNIQICLSRTLKSAVKEIVGTCVSLGVLVENKSPAEVEKEIDAGKYDDEILHEKTETSEAKRSKIEKFFAEVKAAQEKLQKQEEAAKAAAEAAAATTAATPTTTAAPTPAAAPAKPAAAKAK